MTSHDVLVYMRGHVLVLVRGADNQKRAITGEFGGQVTGHLNSRDGSGNVVECFDHGHDPRVSPNRAYRTPATGCISTSHAPPRRTVSAVMAPLHIALLARTRQVSVIGTPASSQDGTLR